MNFKKSFLGLALAVILSTPTFAFNTTSVDKEVKDYQALKELKSYIQDIDINITDLDQKTVRVRFMVTDDNQVVVLSTDNKSLDATIKYSLNYKSLKSNELAKNHIYVLPVAFKDA